MIWIFDFIILMLFSFPVFIGYIVGILVYFYKFDRKPPKINGTPPNGLSRFCLKGIMFLFGLILFDLIIQFFVSYSMLFVERYGYETGIPFGFTAKSVFFNSLLKKNRDIPINVLINFTIVCTTIYTSTEGVIAGLKTINLKPGLIVELPFIKRQRLSAMFIIWCFLAIVSTIYVTLVGNGVTFEVINIYVGAGITLAILFMAERAPSVLKDTSKHKAGVTEDTINPTLHDEIVNIVKDERSGHNKVAFESPTGMIDSIKENFGLFEASIAKKQEVSYEL